MNKQVRIRMGKALVVLALVLGIVGFSWSSAEASACYYYIGCEYCSCMEQGCIAGTEVPECGANYSCCVSAFRDCWRWCIWY